MAWNDQVGGEVSSAYSFDNLAATGGDFFGKALSGWLQYETIQAQRDATAAKQAETRNQPTTTSAQPNDYADTGSARMGGGLTATHLVVGGVLLAAVVLAIK